MKTDLFQSCGHCWVFQICWHIACSTFTASSVRAWNSSIEVPSPPLALFIMMLPKATWLRIPECLALGEWSYHHVYPGHEDLFCIFLCFLALFLISSAFVPSILWWEDSVSPCHLLTWAGKETFITLLFLTGKNTWFHGAWLQDVSQVSVVLVDKRKFSRVRREKRFIMQ